MKISGSPDIGQLRHYVELQRFQKTGQDQQGQPIGDWITYADVFAAARPLYGRNIEIARQLYAASTEEMVIRFRSDVRVGDRLKWNGETWAIGYLANMDERNVWLRLLISKVQ